MPKNVLFSL